MSKKGRKTRPWHYRRIQREFDRKPEEIITEMFEYATPLTVMAGALGISYGEMHEWVHELGLERDPITPYVSPRTKVRITEEYGIDAIQLICSERANGMSYKEIREKYDVSSGFIADCLHRGAPQLIGTHDIPVTVRPPKLSDELRKQMSERCKKHNQEMKEKNKGWFANHAE